MAAGLLRVRVRVRVRVKRRGLEVPRKCSRGWANPSPNPSPDPSPDPNSNPNLAYLVRVVEVGFCWEVGRWAGHDGDVALVGVDVAPAGHAPAGVSALVKLKLRGASTVRWQRGVEGRAVAQAIVGGVSVRRPRRGDDDPPVALRRHGGGEGLQAWAHERRGGRRRWRRRQWQVERVGVERGELRARCDDGASKSDRVRAAALGSGLGLGLGK